MESRNGTRETGSSGPGGATAAPERVAIRSYRDIEAYQRSMTLLRPLHDLLKKLPRDEQFELASQLRRSSKSIPANIAEGFGKKRSAAQFRAALDHALGSTNETIVHLEIAVAVGYVTQDEVQSLIDGYEVVAKQVYRLMQVWRDFKR